MATMGLRSSLETQNPSFRGTTTADRLIAEGNSAERSGDLRGACINYLNAVNAAPDHAMAHLNLGIALAATGDIAGALESYERALAIDPRNPFINYNLAIVVQSQNDLPRAKELLLAALATKPDFTEARLALANLYDAQGDLDRAAECLRVVLSQRPDHAGAHNNLGTVLQAHGKLVEAIACYGKALALNPDYAGAHFNLANLLRLQGDIDGAVKSFRAGLALKPDFVDGHFKLGNLFQMRGEFDDAANCFRAALALQPLHAEAHNNLGTVLQSQGKLDEALDCYEAAVSIRPDFAEAHCNLGNLFRAQRKLDHALPCYQKAISLKPDFAEAHYNLGSLFELDEALPHYQRALALKPDYALARWAIALAQAGSISNAEDDREKSRAAFASALEDLDRWFDANRIQEGFKAVGSLPPFYVAYEEANNRDLLARHGNLCVRLMKHWQDQQEIIPCRPRVGDRIRVGIISAYIYDQSVWRAIVRGWIQHIDRARFSLNLFYTGTLQDHETRFAQAGAAYFAQGPKEFRQWVDTILSRQLDVILYPEIGMDPLTLRLASLRLAPVQAATWGHPETTGLPTIDYYLSAEGLEPEHAGDNYTEQLIALPHLGCSYQPQLVAPIALNLEALRIHGDRTLFLCAGTPYKYAPRNDSVFVEIAQQGECHFIFSTHNYNALSDRFRARLEELFAKAGLDFKDYGVFLPWLPRPLFYGLLRRADVYLDTIGFSGFNTAMQTIECSLPIVTYEGRFLRGRLASGILKRMGLMELVTTSKEEYVMLAVKLAQDGSYRTRMRDRIEASRQVLFNDVAPIRALEEFLINVVRQH